MVEAGTLALCGDAIGGLFSLGEEMALGAPNSNPAVPTRRSSRKQEKLFTALQCRDTRHKLDFVMKMKRLSRLSRGAVRPSSQEVFQNPTAQCCM